MVRLTEWLLDMKSRFILNFIDDERWRYLIDGLQVTLEITFGAVIFGYPYHSR